jgi:hypothetical protein
MARSSRRHSLLCLPLSFVFVLLLLVSPAGKQCRTQCTFFGIDVLQLWSSTMISSDAISLASVRETELLQMA